MSNKASNEHQNSNTSASAAASASSREQTSTLNAVFCPLAPHGCVKIEIDKNSLAKHYATEIHQKSLSALIKKICETEFDDRAKSDEQRQLRIVQYYEHLSISAQSIQILNDQTVRLYTDSQRCSTQLSAVTRESNNLTTDIAQIKTEIESLTVNQDILQQDLASLTQRLKDETFSFKQQPPDGTLLWKITNVQEKMLDAQSERQPSIYSVAFYSSACGYKLCVRLYLNGDGAARGTHLSIFLVILRGPFDATLKWPFSYRVSFCLYDQRSISANNQTTHPPRHIIDSFRPDTKSSSFQRPRSAMNIASGIPRFVSLADLNQSPDINPYVVNDSIFIKVYIDFAEIPKSILPFVFSLNNALPIHVHQALIAEELKRHQESKQN